MAVSISKKVNIKPGIISPVKQENIQNCLLLSNKNKKFQNHETQEYKNAKEVAEVFGYESKEHNFAKNYFQSYVGATKTPEKLIIGENYTLEAKESEVITKTFDNEEELLNSLKKIGAAEAQPSTVFTKDFEKNEVFNSIKLYGSEDPLPSSIQNSFDGVSEGETKESLLAKLRLIGQDGRNKGNFSIVFKVVEEEITATTIDLDFSEKESLDDCLTYLTEQINSSIENEENLGGEYKIDISLLDLEEDEFSIVVTTINEGSKYNMLRIVSTQPVDIDNPAEILKLNDASDPIKTEGKDKNFGTFIISFKKSDEEIIAVKNDNLDFSTKGTFEEAITYLQNEINTLIESEVKLGELYKITVTVKDTTDTACEIFIKTNNSGTDYNIIGCSGNVAETLFLTEDQKATFIPGTDKKLGNLIVYFNKTGEEIQAEAKDIDLSASTSLNEALSTIQTKLNEAINSTEGLGGSYILNITKKEQQETQNDTLIYIVFSTINKGSQYNIVNIDSTLPLEGDTIASILSLRYNIHGTMYSPGQDETTTEEVLDKYTNERSDFWTIYLVDSTDDLRYKISDWVNQKNNGCRYVYIVDDNDETAKTTKNNQDTFGFALQQKGVKGTTVVFGNEKHAGFIAGIAASIDYNKKDGTITFSGRRQNNLEVTVNNDKEVECLESNYYNYYCSYSSTNPKYRSFETGFVSGSDNQNYLDSLFNQIWLLNSLQTALLNLLLDKNKLPFNDKGYGLISSCCNDTINLAKDNGIIVSGVNLDDNQKQTVNEAVGKDVSNDLYAYGYYLYIGDNTPTDRLNRIAKNCLLYYCDGGAIQKIEFTANVLL